MASSNTSNTNVKVTAVILGGTGDLGLNVSKIFLTEYRSSFPTVRITTRDPNSAKARELARLGGELQSLETTSLDSILSGADVVVNALSADVQNTYKDALAAGIARHNVKVYFLGEFGADYKYNDFPGYEHSDWPQKRAITKQFRDAVRGKQTKVIAMPTGMFLEWLFSPGLGIDVEKNVYTVLGPGSLRVATTAKDDIARSLARLAILALDPATVGRVPDDVRISGQNISFEEVRDTVARVKGVPRGEIKSEDLAAFKGALRANPTENVLPFLRVLIGEGKLDFSSENANELVNPGESLWKWKTLEEHLRNA